MNIRNKRAKMIFRVDLAYIIKWSAVKIFIEVLLHYSCFLISKAVGALMLYKANYFSILNFNNT